MDQIYTLNLRHLAARQRYRACRQHERGGRAGQSFATGDRPKPSPSSNIILRSVCSNVRPSACARPHRTRLDHSRRACAALSHPSRAFVPTFCAHGAARAHRAACHMVQLRALVAVEHPAVTPLRLSRLGYRNRPYSARCKNFKTFWAPSYWCEPESSKTHRSSQPFVRFVRLMLAELRTGLDEIAAGNMVAAASASVRCQWPARYFYPSCYSDSPGASGCHR